MTPARKTHALIAFAVASAAIGIPLLAGFGLLGGKALFGLFAGDSMYYMAVADNVLKYGIPTMDGLNATNGFHPLWQWLLVLLLKCSPTRHGELWVAFAACAVLVIAAYSIVSYGLLRLFGTWPGITSSLLLFPGIYTLAFEPKRHAFNEPGLLYTLAPESAVNGMETPLSLLLWALLFINFIPRLFHAAEIPAGLARINWLFPLSVRLLLPLIVLARLDDIFLVVAIATFIVFQDGLPLRDQMRAIAFICWPVAAAVILYLAYNYFAVGMMLPASATIKLHNAGDRQLGGFLAIIMGTHANWWGYAVRFFPLVFSLLAGIALWSCGRYCKTPGWALKSGLQIFGLYLVIKAFFLLDHVALMDQGYWYYFVMIGMVNLCFAMLVGAALVKYPRYTGNAVGFCLLPLMFHIPTDIAYMTSRMEAPHNTMSDAYALWNNGDSIRQFLEQKAPNAKLLEPYDGLFAYMLDMPADTWTGYASSPQSLAQRHKLGRWDSLLKDGYTLLPDYPYIQGTDLPNYVKVIDTYQPPASPVKFLRLELVGNP